MTLDDLIRCDGFHWRLRVLMTMADIRPQELADRSGISIKTIYRLRTGAGMPPPEVRERLLKTIEKWRPGVLEMVFAAEQCRHRQRRYTSISARQ